MYSKVMRGLICVLTLAVASTSWALPQYTWSVVTPIASEIVGPTTRIIDFSRSGAVAYKYEGEATVQYWNGSKFTQFTRLENLQSNSAGEIVTRSWFRRSLNGPEEKIPLWNGRGASIRGITENGEIYGGFVASDPIYELSSVPFIYNIRTGALTIPERPVEHTEPNGSIARMDDQGRYVIAGWSIWRGDPTRGTLVDPRGNCRFPLIGFDQVHMNGIGGAITETTAKGRYCFAGTIMELPGLGAKSISDDLIVPWWDFHSGEDLSLHQIVGNDYVKYKIHDVTLGLPADMRVNHGYIRPDGAIAAFGRRDGQYYLLQFTPVPEPATLTALAIGCLVLRRRK